MEGAATLVEHAEELVSKRKSSGSVKEEFTILMLQLVKVR